MSNVLKLKRRGTATVKKAATKAPPFAGYSEKQWSEIKRRGTVPWVSVDWDGLRNMLEWLGRNYASLRPKSFAAEAKRLAKIRRQIVEKSRLPAELLAPSQQRAAEAVGESERFYHECTFELGRGCIVRIAGFEANGRERSMLDIYIELLIGVWVQIGGDWWSRGLNTQEAKAFIDACAEPVVGEESASVDAVGKRLQRLIKRGRTIRIGIGRPDGQVAQVSLPLPPTARRSHGQTKPD